MSAEQHPSLVSAKRDICVSMRFRGWTIAAVAGVLAVIAPAASAATTHEATANGNPFAGGLSFAPAELTIVAGDTVRWTNTDAFVPHTATEINGVFDVGGDYGIPGQTGFGPGEAGEWQFAGGAYDYFCKIHPEMTGHIDAPVRVRPKGRGKEPSVVVTWATTALAEGQLAQVQRSKNGGAFRTVLDGTTDLKGRFEAKRGQELAFRSRVWLESNPGKASGWSPPTAIAID
jgi:plastocyanin